MYYTEANQGSVFAYDLATNTDLGSVFTVAGSSGLATIAYDGTNIYLGDYSGTNHVYKYSLGGTLLQTLSLVNCSSFCDGLEYANGFLFSNRRDGADGSPSFYDEYDLNGNLVKAAFISAQYGATGIAYDGTDYFVSDVYNGRLGVYDSTGTFVNFLALKNATNLIEDLSVDYSQRVDTGGTPEPSTWTAMALGLSVLLVRRARRA
jgi:hypothetical protein